MIRAKIVYIRASTKELDRLFACNRESGKAWNHCLYLAKEHYVKYGNWITKTELQEQIKGQFHLHSQSIQAVAHKYLFARDATRQVLQKGMKTAKYPYKQKEH